MTIECEVTRYAVVDDRLVETTELEQTSVHVNDGWLSLGNSSASALVDRLPILVDKYGFWLAQAGTAPVKVERTPECDNPYGCCGRVCQAGWGGRNYPEIKVYKAEIERVLEELMACES